MSLVAAQPAQAQSGTVTCKATVDVTFSTQFGEFDVIDYEAVGTYLNSLSQGCFGSVGATLKIRVKFYDIQGRELTESGALMPTTQTDRYELAISTAPWRGGSGSSKTGVVDDYFDGYEHVWNMKPANAATAIRSYKVYASAGSQDARASAQHHAETPSKLTKFVRLPDGTGPDETP